MPTRQPDWANLTTAEIAKHRPDLIRAARSAAQHPTPKGKTPLQDLTDYTRQAAKDSLAGQPITQRRLDYLNAKLRKALIFAGVPEAAASAAQFHHNSPLTADRYPNEAGNPEQMARLNAALDEALAQ